MTVLESGSDRSAPLLVGREVEQKWLHERLGRMAPWVPIVVAGGAGSGKSALVRQVVAHRRVSSDPVWLDLWRSARPVEDVTAAIERLHAARVDRTIVVMDGADGLSDGQMAAASRAIINKKSILAHIFITARTPIMPGAEILNLTPLGQIDTKVLLQKLLAAELTAEMLDRAVQITAGYPAAARLLAELVGRGNRDDVEVFLRGEIYDLGRNLQLAPTRIIGDVKPQIIDANKALLAKLKQQPESVFQLPSRKFEEIIAELLDDMGFEIEMTKGTRDGGKDILAYINTGIGKLLCLVEAKRHRRDRKVGVEIVRTLYGTLCDYRANSAMLVTTSSFSADARAFEKKHKYQLSLQDYGNVVQWIQGYKKR